MPVVFPGGQRGWQPGQAQEIMFEWRDHAAIRLEFVTLRFLLELAG